MKAVITSVKHVVQRSLSTIEEQTASNVKILDVVTAEPTTPNQVVVGCVVKAIFLEYWFLGESSQPISVTWIIEKCPNGTVPMTFAQSSSIHTYENKRNILRLGQGVVGDSNTNPVPVIREWIKIPKGKQRMAQGDTMHFSAFVVGQTDNGGQICGVSIYKEYQ